MKKIFSLFFVLLICIMMVSCVKTSEGTVQVYRNFIEVNSLSEAEEIVGFGIDIDEKILGDGYEKRIQVIEQKLIEVHYNQLDQWIIIRKALYNGDEDISGDYNEYPKKDTKIVDDIKFITRGSSDEINVVCWKKQGYSYSLNINPGGIGFDDEKVFSIVLQIS